MDAVALADNTSQIVYSGGDDGLIKVWDRRTLDETSPTPVGVLAGHQDGITYLDSKVIIGNSKVIIDNSEVTICKSMEIISPVQSTVQLVKTLYSNVNTAIS